MNKEGWGGDIQLKDAKIMSMKLYKAIIRPVVVYGSECWVLTENINQKLLVFERKILRRIFGPTQKANGEWRLETNEELEKAINNENIVRYIKYKRLSWLGHVERMTNERLARPYTNGNCMQQD